MLPPHGAESEETFLGIPVGTFFAHQAWGLCHLIIEYLIHTNNIAQNTIDTLDETNNHSRDLHSTSEPQEELAQSVRITLDSIANGSDYFALPTEPQP